MAQRNKAQVARAAALKAGPLMVCEGGPLASRWYSEADWKVMRDAEAHTIEHEDRRPLVGPYKATKRTVANPTIDVTGTVWQWTGPPEEDPSKPTRRTR